MKQEFIEIGYGDVLGTARKLHSEGYRMVQICGVTGQGETESITSEYWAAFVYENEIHDLFGVGFADSRLDYKGNFFRMSAETPWKGAEKKEGA